MIRLGGFIWEFVVGDDWRVAVGVVLALALTALLAGAGASAWWVMPVAAALLLGHSVWRASRSRDRSPGRTPG